MNTQLLNNDRIVTTFTQNGQELVVFYFQGITYVFAWNASKTLLVPVRG